MSELEFVDEKERLYFAQAKLGEEVHQFLRSDVGRYLHGCAMQEVEELRDALEKCNPASLFGRRKIKRLQQDAKAARLFMRWMTEAINTGEAAYQQIKEYRDE